MSAVQALRDKAQKAAAALRTAEAAAERAAVERQARNDERRAAFWSDAAERATAAVRAAREARGVVVDLVATGDTSGALAAYTEYVRAVAEARTLVGLAKDRTAVYVHPATRVVKEADNPRKERGGYVGHAVHEAYEARTLVRDWHRTNDGPPPGVYRVEYALGLPTSVEKLEPFTALLEAGVTRLTDTHAAEFRAEVLAPLDAQLEPED